jgi:hypothetical protein
VCLAEEATFPKLRGEEISWERLDEDPLLVPDEMHVCLLIRSGFSAKNTLIVKRSSESRLSGEP